MSKTTPKDHLIVLREFPMDNKAHAMSSSILSASKLFNNVSKLLASEYKVTSELYHICSS